MRVIRVALFHLFVLASAILIAPASPFAQIGVSVTVAPPVLPVYVQPPIPGPGYLWTPGYWAYGPLGYYWVPGTWVRPPAVGLLWTPGYWGWGGGGYLWRGGFWGPHIGFYGGINYGFGYIGTGYQGGYWNNGAFYYNRAVNNVSNTRITNVYNRTVIVNRTTNVSYNGGTGGVRAEPTPAETAAAREQRVAATPAQLQHEKAASTNRELLASVNHGSPAVAATAKPGEFAGRGVVAARGATPARPREAAPHGPTATGAVRERETSAPGAPQEHRNPAPQAPHRPSDHAVPPRGAPERAAQQRGAAQQRAEHQHAVQQRAAQPARAPCREGEPGCRR